MLEQLKESIYEPGVIEAIESLTVSTNQLGYDPWGFSPEQSKLYYSLAYKVSRYFRPVVTGIENLPAGRVLVVANHSGQLPFDALALAVATLTDASPPRLVRAMAERWVPTLPFISEVFNRAGVVLGDPVNCRNLLEAENAILVFPEGVRGSGKTWWHRYRLASFGRGFMRLALQTKAPIVPVAVIGAEESIVSLYDAQPIAKILGMPYFPVPALLPLLGPLAFLPMPTRFHLHFGQAIHLTGPFDDEDEVIEKKVKLVMEQLQSMIDKGLAQRGSVFG